MRRMGRQGMVASPHYLATAAGVDILRRGGNAIDAAIATNAVLATVTPHLCGMGGDLFALVYRSTDGTLIGLNGSGRAPHAATAERVRALAGNDRMPERGPLPITVPGCVDAWGVLHERFGRLPLADILAAAIRYAKEGFPITSRFAQSLTVVSTVLHPDTPARETFFPGGATPREGAILTQPRLAETLHTIARQGTGVFYRGAIAGEVVRSVQAIGGLLACEDLAAHRADWVEPLSVRYRDVTVYELPPNSQGIVALLMLSMLEHVPSAALSADDAGYVHHLAEVARLAYADRDRYVTDPEHMTIDPATLLASRHGRERMALVGDRISGAVTAGEPGDTAYLCTADNEGTLVSLIESNYMGIGSGVMAGETGVMLQNRGASFSLLPGHPNVIASGKRTMHTLMPGMAFQKERPWLVFGTMGGSMQPQIHVQLLTRLLDQGMPLDAAIGAPRFDAAAGADGEGRPLIRLEDRFPREVFDGLARRGHATQALDAYSSAVGHAHAIQILENDMYVGAADPRTDSLALGY
ncbi:MAG: gamma-glutamyltransferase [Chloroflexota bacterium]